MSALFQYSINDLEDMWKKGVKDGTFDKSLQAITTTINPNLGFKASSFFGCNFIPVALRPAKFTFVESDGMIQYKTRRSIDNTDENYFENRFEILPLNEMILCLDKNIERNVINNNILLIDKLDYDEVLNNDIESW